MENDHIFVIFINTTTIFNKSRLNWSVLQVKNEVFPTQLFFCGCSFSRSHHPIAFCEVRHDVPHHQRDDMESDERANMDASGSITALTVVKDSRLWPPPGSSFLPPDDSTSHYHSSALRRDYHTCDSPAVPPPAPCHCRWWIALCSHWCLIHFY